MGLDSSAIFDVYKYLYLLETKNRVYQNVYQFVSQFVSQKSWLLAGHDLGVLQVLIVARFCVQVFFDNLE